jgi:hypothetical protein
LPPFAPSNRVVLLGAGATLGAVFPNFTPECRPPLNADFFTQLQRITTKHQKLIREVMADIVSLFGSNFTLSLEEYFTQLEFLAEAVKLAPAGGPAFSSADLRVRRERLMGALAAVLEMSTDIAVRQGGGCALHQRLVEQLQAKDTLITFNYDCVLDHALRRHAVGKWSTRYGYTFPSEYTIENEDAWDADPPASASTRSIHVLKLHGSLNWQVSDNNDHIKMKRRLHRQNGIPKFTVIPPVWNKLAMDQHLFKVLWQNAERAIRNARHIAVVGFSFTPTDLHVQSLFRVALAKSNLKTLVIANPSQEDRGHVRAVFAKALERNVIVRQYTDFEAFVSAYPECFS